MIILKWVQGKVNFTFSSFKLLLIKIYYYRGGPGIWVDQDFSEGYSADCGTFRSPTLSSTEDFTCTVFEAWSFDTANLTDYF